LLTVCGHTEPATIPTPSIVYALDPTATYPIPETGNPTPTSRTSATAIPANPDINHSAIAFTSARDGNMEIYIMETEGNMNRRIDDN
jgi:hypothetical protein